MNIQIFFQSILNSLSIKLILVTLATAFCVNNSDAQEQISFTWTSDAEVAPWFQVAINQSNSLFTVDWGDGKSSTFGGGVNYWPTPDSYQPTHKYARKGIYNVIISANSNNGHVKKLTVHGINSIDAPNLEVLEIGGNQLTNLDLSRNTNLEGLSVNEAQFTKLDLSKNTNLKSLSILNTQMTRLELSKNTALKELNCYNNQLITLDLAKFTALERLDCSGNQLTSLDVSKNSKLKELVCANNKLTQLDVTKNANLISLNCANNLLSDIDLSKNSDLVNLNCSNNQLFRLDISKNPKLGSAFTEYLSCDSNRLTLADLYAASQQVTTVYKKNLGRQVLPTVELATDMPVVVQDPIVFGGKTTTFWVYKGFAMAPDGDFTRSGGIVAFNNSGTYTIEMSHPAFASMGGRVVATYVVAPNAAPPAETPIISQHPQSAIYNEGSNAAPLNVAATVTDGGALSYQWFANPTPHNAGGDWVGDGDTFTPTTNKTGTLYYYAVVTNTNHGTTGRKPASAISSVAAITVTETAATNVAIPVITGQPQHAAYNTGDTAKPLSVVANNAQGGTLSYEWFSHSINHNSGGSLVSEEAEFIPPTDIEGTFYYYVTVTNTDTSASGIQTAATNSNVAVIHVDAAKSAATPFITQHPLSAVYNVGDRIALISVSAGSADGGALSYTWYNNSTYSNEGGTRVGTGPTYTPPATLGTQCYYVVITNTIYNESGVSIATATSKPVLIIVSNESEKE